MSNEVSAEQFWDSASSVDRTFQPEALSNLPAEARRYLEHAISPGAALARAAQLRMHGQIKLQRWVPFQAEQSIVWGRGFIWRATVTMFAIPIKGSDRLVDGHGAMQWKLFGLIPFLNASGPDIARSAAGRLAGEVVWVPSVLCEDEVLWKVPEPSHVQAAFTAHGETAKIDINIDDRGRLKTAKMQRWGNPDNTGFRYVDFGVIVEEETSFGGYTIPSRIRAGWYFGSDRFEPEGEFFRATITDVKYR